MRSQSFANIRFDQITYEEHCDPFRNADLNICNLIDTNSKILEIIFKIQEHH
jgi:hypothetical protein